MIDAPHIAATLSLRADGFSSRSIRTPTFAGISAPGPGQTWRIFLPFDGRIGRKFTKTLTVSLEAGVPIGERGRSLAGRGGRS
jgi:hypothetical protein